MAIQDEYIVTGAIMSCNETQLPYPAASSIFRCINPIHKIQGKDVGTDSHKIPMVNVLPFGQCRILTAAALGTPTPCVPFPEFWEDTNNQFLSGGIKTLLLSSYTTCAFGGCIQFKSSGQQVATLSNLPQLPGVSPIQLNQVVARPGNPLPTSPLPQLPATPPQLPLASINNIFVLEPGDGASVGWNPALNVVPLAANAKYLVGNYLYEVDGEGRVAAVRGVLVLQKGARNEYQQGRAPRKKDGLPNPGKVADPRTASQKQKNNPAYVPDPRTAIQRRMDNPRYKRDPRTAPQKNPASAAYVPDPRTALQKRKDNLAYVPDTRTALQKQKTNLVYINDPRAQWEQREFVDDGGHLFGAQFNGPAEQINYVPQHVNQNQKQGAGSDNWFKMEDEWSNHLKAGKKVFIRVKMSYSKRDAGNSLNKMTMRPYKQTALYWIDGEAMPVKYFLNK